MSKGGSKTPTTTTQTNTIQKADPWSGVQPYLTQLYGSAGNIFANQPQQYFPYQTYAQQSPLTGAGQQGLLGYATNALPSLFESGNQGLASQLNAVDVANNPYVNNMISAQAQGINDQLARHWLPQIRTGAGQAGQYGGSRQGIAEGLAMSEAAKAFAQSAAQTQMGAYGQGLDAQARALAFLPQQAQLGMLPAQLYGQVGGMQEGWNDKAIQDAMARWGFAQQEPYNRASWFNSILTGAAPYSSSSSSGTSSATNPNTSSTAANVLGGGLTGYSLGSALSSGIAAAVPGAAATGMAPTLFGMGLGPIGAIGGALLGGLFG